jgi:quercetin dioxygenase-like cupin family protein
MDGPYALKAGEGWGYRFDIDQTVTIDLMVKTGELDGGPRLAMFEFATRAGEEPPDHTHATEDEIFYVLKGAVTFRCGDNTFAAENGGFVFLPRGIEHGYTIRGGREARLLVVTAPAQEGAGGWGGFVGGFQAVGGPRTSPPGDAD